MVEIAHVCLMKEASQENYSPAFEEAVFDYISSHSKLTPNEKVLWLNMAKDSFQAPSPVYALTYAQIAKLANVGVSTAKRAVLKFKQLNLIQVDYNKTIRLITYRIELSHLTKEVGL